MSIDLNITPKWQAGIYQIEKSYLTRKQLEILILFAEGHRRDRVAERIRKHNSTVQSHLVSLKRKIGGKTVTELIARAVFFELIEPIDLGHTDCHRV